MNSASTITREDASKLIQASNGSVFSVTFTKKDGSTRHMNCRMGVTKHLKGGERAYDPADHGLVCVYDMQARGYRSIALDTLRRLTMGGNTWNVV